jgi:hypothetical protein
MSEHYADDLSLASIDGAINALKDLLPSKEQDQDFDDEQDFQRWLKQEKEKPE